MDPIERSIEELLREERLTDGLFETVLEPVLVEYTASRCLKPALKAIALTDAVSADAPLDELAAKQVLKPAIRDEELVGGRETRALADRIMDRIKSETRRTLEGIPQLSWIGTAFALGFALVISVARRQNVMDLFRTGRWHLFFGTLGVFVAAATLLFNASRLVGADERVTRVIFGAKTTRLIARSEMVVVQAFGLVLILTFCWMFFGLTGASGLPALFYH